MTVIQQNTQTAAGGSILRAHTEREREVSIYRPGRERQRER
jgi:hypothetical protein